MLLVRKIHVADLLFNFCCLEATHTFIERHLSYIAFLTQLMPNDKHNVLPKFKKLWYFWFHSSDTPTISVYLVPQALIEAHDDIAAKNFEHVPEFLPVFAPPPQVFQVPPADAIRMVGIRKTPDEPLVRHSFVFSFVHTLIHSFIHLFINLLTH